MEKLKKLMEDIDMPAEAAARVLAAEPPFSADQTEALSERLTDKDRYKEAAPGAYPPRKGSRSSGYFCARR